MTNFDKITASPAVLGTFLGSLPVLTAPWDDDFHREFCDACEAENCDGENCPHNAERDNPTRWLGLEAADAGHVYDKAEGYRRQVRNLRLEAMHQENRFSRKILAQELRDAAATIETLLAKLEATNGGK